MASELTHYRVILAVYYSVCELGHHSIFVDTEQGKGGHLFHVVGNAQHGMTLEMRKGEEPFGSPLCLWVQQIGWVSHDKFDKIKPICEMVPPPGKQWHKAKLLVPLNQLRLNPDWVAEAANALREEGVLEELGPGDDGSVIVNFAHNHNHNGE